MKQNIRQMLFIYEQDLASIVERLESLEQNDSTPKMQSGPPLEWKLFEDMDDRFFIDTVDKNIQKSSCIEKVNASQPTEHLRIILGTLGLSSKYPQKISLQDVQSVHDNMFSEPEVVTDIPWAILRKIFAVDFSFREMVLEDFINKHEMHTSLSYSEGGFSFSRLMTEEDNSDSCDINDQIQNLHPSDVLIAILSCATCTCKRCFQRKLLSVKSLFPSFTKML